MGKKGDIFANPAKKVSGFIKFIFRIGCIVLFFYGIYECWTPFTLGDYLAAVWKFLEYAVIGPIILYIFTLFSLIFLDVCSAIREIADKTEDQNS